MPAISRALLVLLAALVLAPSPDTAWAQANRQTLNRVSQLLLNAHNLLTQDENTKAARAECEKAQDIEEQTKDPFVSATVEMCFGDVEDHAENTNAACKHYEKALKYFKAVPAKHSAQRTLKTHMNVTEGKRLTLGCGA